MLKFKKISIRNFMSFGNKPVELSLNTDESIMIIGNNEDSGSSGKSKNGVGKSSAIQALIYSLYGKGIEKELKNDDYINLVNEKKMEVRLTFEKDGVDYMIFRSRKPNKVEFYRYDGETEVSLTRDSMKNTDALIEETLGIPYEVFMGIYFSSPHKKSFMAMNTGEQRGFIESVLSLDILAKRAETLKLVRKDVQVDLKLAERDVEQAQTNNQKAQENIERITEKKENWDDGRRISIKELESEIAEIASIDFYEDARLFDSIEELKGQMGDLREQSSGLITAEIDYKIKTLHDARNSFERDIKLADQEMDKRQSEIDKISEQLSQLEGDSVEEYRELTAEIDTALKQIDEFEKSIRHAEADKKDAENELNKVINPQIERFEKELESLEQSECPYCHQEHVDKEKLKEVRLELEELAGTKKEAQAIIEECDDEISTIKKKLSEFEASDVLRKELSEIEREGHKFHTLSEQLKTATDNLNNPNPYQESVDEFYAEYESLESLEQKLEKLDTERHAINKKREDIDAQLSDKTSELRELKEKLSGVVDSKSEIDAVLKEKAGLENRLVTQREEVNPYIEELEHAKSMVADISELEDARDYQIKREKHIGYLIKLLTDPKSFVRKNIVDQYVPYLNKKINEYTQSLSLPHVIQVNPDLTTNISYMQKDVSYYNMSQGERLRLNVSTTMAFRDLMTLLGKNVNMMFFDEMIDSAVDLDGGVKILKLVTSKSDNFWFISHRDEFIDYMDKIMVVTKSNGFSSISWR